MSKTFNSIHKDFYDMEVDTHPDGSVRLSIDADDFVGFCISPSDAPALALAILEAAGVESAYRSAYNAGSDWQLDVAVDHLRIHIEERERIAAEAEAQEKLEAEALELYKAHTGYTLTKFLSEAAAPDRWLAVARRAREINKEEK